MVRNTTAALLLVLAIAPARAQSPAASDEKATGSHVLNEPGTQTERNVNGIPFTMQRQPHIRLKKYEYPHEERWIAVYVRFKPDVTEAHRRAILNRLSPWDGAKWNVPTERTADNWDSVLYRPVDDASLWLSDGHSRSPKQTTRVAMQLVGAFSGPADNQLLSKLDSMRWQLIVERVK